MDIYCVLGNPVAHTHSPWIHGRFAELAGQSLVYEKRLVPLDGFDAALREFRAVPGARGCNVSVPFKLEAARHADARSQRVVLAGAANTLVFRDGLVHADNTDGLGLVADIQRNAGVVLAGLDVLLVGAGGAASGVLAPLIESGVRGITLVNRTAARAEALAATHGELAAKHGTRLRVDDIAAVRGTFDVVLNASASSLKGTGVPVGASVLRPGTFAMDLMYGPPAEGFVAWARAHGATARDGLGMLVEQAAEAFLLWRGVRPPSKPVLDELRARLARPAQ